MWATNAEEKAGDRVARRNALLYALCAAFAISAAPVSIALGGLAGSYLLGSDKSLATAPVTGFNIGVALGAMPAALLMQRVGRKYGFMSGAFVGIVGMAVSAYAVVTHSFALFVLGLMMNGIAGGFTQQFRFAATDRGAPEFRAKAISWVLAGGVAAAVIGPQLVIWTTDLLAPVPFAGAFLSATCLFVVVLFVLSFLDPSMPPRRRAGEARDTGRPLTQIMRQPRFLVSVLCGTASFALMSFVMTAAPLAMIGCGFSQTEATLGIQWHSLAMFAPSFFTGHLINRFGSDRVVAAGLTILAVCAGVALAGIELAHFWISLVLLGVGWNFGFIGATAMLTDTYRPEERSKAQGANDALLFSTVAVASLMSGQTLNAFGWTAVNLLAFPVVAICLAALLWLSRRQSNAELAA
jgi:predicted MFS family arabinose efflux permease